MPDAAHAASPAHDRGNESADRGHAATVDGGRAATTGERGPAATTGERDAAAIGEHGAVVATAPVRCCDVGGWTDTWFARHGRVCALAVGPGARVRVTPARHETVLVVDHGRHTVRLGDTSHQLLQAAVRASMPSRPARIEVGALVPPGAGVGTSSAVVNALLGALDAFERRTRTRAELAVASHAVDLSIGLQSGVQDQWASAFGGITDLSVDYPHATHTAVPLDPAVSDTLAERLVTVYFGAPHSSDASHRGVIERLEHGGDRSPLEQLRALAGDAVDALVAGDLDEYARTLDAATAAMGALDPRLVNDDARALRALLGDGPGVGMKVNGAGGAGGSASCIAPGNPVARRALCNAIDAHPRWSRLALTPSADGLVAHRG